MTDSKKTDINSLNKIEIHKLISIDNFHVELPKFINTNNIVIGNYNDLANVIVTMISKRYFFNIEKNHLKDLMDDLVFMYNPSSDDNISRVQNLLCDTDSDSDSD